MLRANGGAPTYPVMVLFGISSALFHVVRLWLSPRAVADVKNDDLVLQNSVVDHVRIVHDGESCGRAERRFRALI